MDGGLVLYSPCVAEFESRVRTMRDVVDHGFGGGTRVCTGRHLALLGLWKLLATVCSMFDTSDALDFPICLRMVSYSRGLTCNRSSL